MKIKLEGVFVVKSIGDEYIEMDAYETGNIDMFEKRSDQGTVEYKESSRVKAGDFLRFSGEYEVERTNDVFTKVRISDQLLSFPNHKIIEVK